MKVIIGLGNPGNDYKNTRHNIGFNVIDALGDKLNIQVDKSKFKGLIGEGFFGSEKIILVKPLTYMNLSGETVEPLLKWYKVDLEDILVIYDDMSLDLGQLRLRPKGSSGGHNGMKSLIYTLNSDAFPRLKFGIGRPAHSNISGYVLGKFSKEEEVVVAEAIEKAVKAVEVFIVEGINQAMNKFN